MSRFHDPPRRVQSVEDSTLTARIVRRCAMRYVAGADAAQDRPEYVRAASGLAWVGERLAVIQDDASFLALVDPATGLADAFALPPGVGGLRQFDDGRGNRAGKLDLEALAILPASEGVLLAAFGSGSMAPRETVVLISFPGGPDVQIALRGASELYAGLREAADFAGSEMNVEGAVRVGGALTLFGRGNGAVRGEIRPVNASCEVPVRELMAYLEDTATTAPPTPRHVRQYDLGELDDVALGFTDVALGQGGAILYSAAAEASPDATRDGKVVGSAVGVLDAQGIGRWTRLRDEGGSPFVGKVEGLTLDPHRADRLFAAIDSDDHRQPSELLEVHLSGSWARGGAVRRH